MPAHHWEVPASESPKVFGVRAFNRNGPLHVRGVERITCSDHSAENDRNVEALHLCTEEEGKLPLQFDNNPPARCKQITLLRQQVVAMGAAVQQI